MTEKRKLLCHFLAALAYRTQKTLREAPADFGSYRAADGVRTPAELISHMTGVLGYACTCFAGGHFKPAPLQALEDEVARFTAFFKSLLNTWRAMLLSYRECLLSDCCRGRCQTR